MADVRLVATNPEDSSVVPVACDASGRFLLEEQGQGPPGEQGPPGPKGEDGKDGDPFSGNFADDVTFGGSAEFAGDATVGSATGGDRGVRIFKDGGVYIYNSSTSPEFAFKIIDKDSNVPVTIKTDGSAEFAGVISTSGQNTTNTASTLKLSQERANVSQIRAYGSNGSTVGSLEFRVSASDGAPSYTPLVLNNDNSATFAGNKAGFTAEGYLWCTTARGDTVMLDATSNGMGVWVEYTPNTRIGEIRDRLDANRGDTGEMPADTP